MDLEQKLCPVCHLPVTDSYYYCPNCGKNLKPVPVSTSFLKQIGIYALSIFLPPLGLWPGIKYLKQGSKAAKTIGIAAIVLTVVSIGVSAWLLTGWVNQMGRSIDSQLNSYQNLGL